MPHLQAHQRRFRPRLATDSTKRGSGACTSKPIADAKNDRPLRPVKARTAYTDTYDTFRGTVPPAGISCDYVKHARSRFLAKVGVAGKRVERRQPHHFLTYACLGCKK